MKKIITLLLAIALFSVLLTSCNPLDSASSQLPVSSDLSHQKSEDNVRFAQTLSLLTNEEVWEENCATPFSRNLTKSCKIGDYVFNIEYSDVSGKMIYTIIRLHEDGENPVVIYESEKVIRNIWVADRETICLQVVDFYGEDNGLTTPAYCKYILLNVLTGEQEVLPLPGDQYDAWELWVSHILKGSVFYSIYVYDENNDFHIDLFRLDAAGNTTLILSDIAAYSYSQNQFYYVLKDDSTIIYSCDINGENKDQINLSQRIWPEERGLYYFAITSNYLFVTGNTDSSIINLETGEAQAFSLSENLSKTYAFQDVDDETLIYMGINMGKSALISFNYKTGQSYVLHESDNRSFFYKGGFGNWVYYQIPSMQPDQHEGALYRIRKDGTDKQQLTGLED